MNKLASESEPISLVHPNGASVVATNDTQLEVYQREGFTPGKSRKSAPKRPVRDAKGKFVKKSK